MRSHPSDFQCAAGRTGKLLTGSILRQQFFLSQMREHRIIFFVRLCFLSIELTSFRIADTLRMNDSTNPNPEGLNDADDHA